MSNTITRNDPDTSAQVGKNVSAAYLISPSSLLATEPGAAIDGQRVTYSATYSGLQPGTAPTDIAGLYNGASGLVKLTRIIVSFTQGTAGDVDLYLIKRSTVDNTGSSTTVPAIPYDSYDAAANAVVRYWTANPSALGTAIGTLLIAKLYGAATTAQADRLILDFGNRAGTKAITLHQNEGVYLNLNGITAPSSASFAFAFEWTES